jgi:quercetin 2,3-dioxygenase
VNTRYRPSLSRGYFDHGWLKTYHTFSFGHYVDPEWMNEDVVAPGQGFGMHGHQDMEILTWVLTGELEHRDSLGHGEILRPGEMQWMSAGTGIRHSEFNPSPTQPVHLYQIWLLPERTGLSPAYAQKLFDPAGRQQHWQVLASPDGRADSLVIRQDAVLAVTDLQPGQSLEIVANPARHGWLQVVRGKATVDGETLSAGDGVGLTPQPGVTITATTDSQVLWFDLG